MPEYNRVIISGTSPGGGEAWSVGLSYGGDQPEGTIGGQSDLDQWSAGIASYLSGLASSNSLLTALSSEGAITQVRTEYRAPDDTLLAASEATLSKAGSGTPSKALQVAFVISLRTGVPGRSFRGRAYWPAWNYTPTTALRFAGSSITLWLADFKALNSNIIAQAVLAFPQYDGALVVRSSTLDRETPVSTAEIGNVPDTQRRRRDALPEVYTATAIP